MRMTPTAATIKLAGCFSPLGPRGIFAHLYDLKSGSMKPVHSRHSKMPTFFTAVTNQVARTTALNSRIINVCSLDGPLHHIENFLFVFIHRICLLLCAKHSMGECAAVSDLHGIQILNPSPTTTPTMCRPPRRPPADQVLTPPPIPPRWSAVGAGLESRPSLTTPVVEENAFAVKVGSYAKERRNSLQQKHDRRSSMLSS